MRLFLTGSDPHQVDAVAREFQRTCTSRCRVVAPAEHFPDVPRNSSWNAQLVTSVGMTMAELSTAASYEKSGLFTSHVLVACNMPLMRGESADGQMDMFPFELYEKDAAISKDVWNACGYVLRNVYGSVGFDYAFRVGGLLPEKELLSDMFVLRSGQRPIDVRSAVEVADIVNYEFRKAVDGVR